MPKVITLTLDYLTAPNKTTLGDFRVVLYRDGVAAHDQTSASPVFKFKDVAPGQYTVICTHLDKAGKETDAQQMVPLEMLPDDGTTVEFTVA